MFTQEFHYRWVGESFRRCVNAARFARSTSTIDAPILRVLDFGCGFGRITRVMRQMFPDAEIVACDVTPDKGKWCALHFGATPHVTEIDLDKLALPGQFDLIWLGSVVTHLNEAYATRLLTILWDHTAEHGLLMVSSRGRHFIRQSANLIHEDATEKTWGLDRRQVLDTLTGVALSDYGFAPFKTVSAFDRAYLDSETADYGTSTVKLEWWSRLVDHLGDARMHFLEAAWDQLHDVVVLQRTPITQVWRRDILP
jgi:SAM-dependent methyltransferase